MSLPNLVGQVLGQYEILELLGMGGMGAVYRAQQLRLKRPVALKVLSPALAAQPGYIERFIREAETAASLEHNHIVPVYDFGADEDWPYIVMRLLTGATLADRLQHSLDHEEPLPSPTEIAALLHQLGAALDYAHSLGVLHRDIKPSNIMFDDRGNPYIVDFGIAKLLEGSASLTASGMSMGTPAYMSPEQWRNEPLTPAADQYALGIITYQLLTGAAPFRATTPYGYMHLHLHEMPPPPHLADAHIPADAGPVLERAIAKHPAARFESVTAFAEAFLASLGETPAGHTGFFTRRIPKRQVVGGFGSSGARHASSPKERVSRRWPVGLAALGVIAIGVAGMTAILRPPGRVTPATTPTRTSPIVMVVPTVTPMPSPLPPTQTPIAIETPTPTMVFTSSPFFTATNRATALPSSTETPAATSSMTSTKTLTLTPSITATATSTASPSPTGTYTPSATSTPTLTITPTAAPSATRTASPTPSPTMTVRPAAPRPIPMPSATPSPAATVQPATPRPIPMPAASPTSTVTSTPTQTPCQLADVNGDGEVDILDIRSIAANYGRGTLHDNSLAALDLNRNGSIDILDVRRVASQYGSVCR